MAAMLSSQIFKARPHLQNKLLFCTPKELVHTSPVYFEVQSGRVKPTLKKNKPVTYEQSIKPHYIGGKKAWNSWNTTTLEGGLRQAETLVDDLLIRKFIKGTFPQLVLSEIIIKRQYNVIRVGALLKSKINSSKFSFLIGFSEEMLSMLLQCPVKLELQIIRNYETVIFKRV